MMGKNHFFFFWDRISWSPGWLSTGNVDEEDLGFLFFHLSLSSARIIDVYQHIPQVWSASPRVNPVLGIKPRALSTEGRHPIIWAMSIAQECNHLEGFMHLILWIPLKGYDRWRKGRKRQAAPSWYTALIVLKLNLNTGQGFLKAVTGLKRWLIG